MSKGNKNDPVVIKCSSTLKDNLNVRKKSALAGFFSCGFTLVEMMAVIIIIGILSTISVISYIGAIKKTAIVTLKSDIEGASAQLAADKFTNNGYPATEAQSNNGKGLVKSDGTQYEYSLVGYGYCLSATSTKASGVAYHISSDVGTIEDGLCPKYWKQVAGGFMHTCAIAYTDKVYCWGDNQYGKLGNNSTTSSAIPVAVDTTGVLIGKIIKSIAVGTDMSCAIDSDGQAYCWGYNVWGQLGNNSNTNSSVPVTVITTGTLTGKSFKSISIGNAGPCAIASDDKVYCWGNGGSGQLGNGTDSDSKIPILVNMTGVLSGKTVKAIGTGESHTCVIASDDKVYCWGFNYYGYLGNNTYDNSSVPVAISMPGVLASQTVKQLSVGDRSACIIAADNFVYCWGYNLYGQLGNNSNVTSSVPVAADRSGLLSSKTIKTISTSGTHACAITTEDKIYCWGRGQYGQLGNNLMSNSLIPVSVIMTGALSGKTIKILSSAAGGTHTCTIASDDQIYCWGSNSYNQLGDNTNVSSSVPIGIYSPF